MAGVSFWNLLPLFYALTVSDEPLLFLHCAHWWHSDPSFLYPPTTFYSLFSALPINNLLLLSSLCLLAVTSHLSFFSTPTNGAIVCGCSSLGALPSVDVCKPTISGGISDVSSPFLASLSPTYLAVNLRYWLLCSLVSLSYWVIDYYVIVSSIDFWWWLKVFWFHRYQCLSFHVKCPIFHLTLCFNW